MKKIISLLLIITMAAGIYGCGANPSQETGEKESETPEQEGQGEEDVKQMGRFVEDTVIITAYSLEDNSVLRQAVHNFNKKNKNAYVKYEIGMDPESGITREDAIKKLNTEIMAGEGPDLMILDGLPADSYLKKGMLADLSPYLDVLEEDVLLTNIAGAYKRDGKIYMMPAEFKVMLLIGKEENIRNIHDLSTFADEAEALREQNPEGSIFGMYTESVVLRMLLMNDLPALIAPDGALDEAKLTEFLTQAGRIYQAETAGLAQEEIEEMKEMMDQVSELDRRKKQEAAAANYCPDIVTGRNRMAVGSLGNLVWESNHIVSLKDVEESYTFVSYPGMKQNVFRPSTMAAINVKSDQQKTAGELLQTIFSIETMDPDVYSRSGFANNRESIQKELAFIKDYYGQPSSSVSLVNNNGEEIIYNLRFPEEQEALDLVKILATAWVPNYGYDEIENVILTLGPDALNGSKSVEETVSEIMKKVAIYLEE